MQALNGRLVLSPSDLNDYVECPHLTTLALEVSRGERERPFLADEHAELLRRKGEPHDAKLARAEKPTYVLQLCFYSAGVAAIQGVPPERMHVLLGIGEQRALRYDDFAAYYRRVRGRFEAAIDAPPATEPYRVDHCSLCQFRGVCAARWDAED